MNTERMYYKLDPDPDTLARPCRKEVADGTWFVVRDTLPNGEEYGLQITVTEVVDELPVNHQAAVERAMDYYRRNNG